MFDFVAVAVSGVALVVVFAACLMWWCRQVLNQSTSMDGLKKSQGYPGSLLEHFYAVFGPPDSAEFKAAQRRFACSLAG